ncbi:MAG: hypothetical protein KatS3mg008_2224 [Acidimicrobiales bacterium]|nr:MAG: hypothetical protein KatS3mg008_2224 [Acidimicrobiales bacterium]
MTDDPGAGAVDPTLLPPVSASAGPLEPVVPQDLPPLRPSTRWYWLAGAVAAVSLTVAAFLFFGGIFGVGRKILSLQVIEVGEVRVVELQEGRHDVYWTGRALGSVAEPEIEPKMRVIGPDGSEIPLDRVPRSEGARQTVTRDGRRGRLVARFAVTTGGRHRIETSGGSEFPASRGDELWVGRSVEGSDFLPIVMAPLVGFIGLAVALVVTVVTLTRRRAALRERGALVGHRPRGGGSAPQRAGTAHRIEVPYPPPPPPPAEGPVG